LTVLCFAADVAAAQLRLGVMYENGIGMRVNHMVGQELFCWLQRLPAFSFAIAVTRLDMKHCVEEAKKPKTVLCQLLQNCWH